MRAAGCRASRRLAQSPAKGRAAGSPLRHSSINAATSAGHSASLHPRPPCCVGLLGLLH